MDRRHVLTLLGSAAVTRFTELHGEWAASAQDGARYSVFGTGPSLLLGPPLTIVRWPGVPDDVAALRQQYLNRLTDRYKVIVFDYPSFRDTDTFTADRICQDILEIADAAGVDRFAWFGYSFGAIIGLQLAARTNRITALVCGGWPPLGAPYAEELAAAQKGDDPGAKITATLMRGLVGWSEREKLRAFTCPCMTFAGVEDVLTNYGITRRLGPPIAENREELERMG